MRNLIYKSKDLTITKEFIILPRGSREAIAIERIKEVRITSKVTGDYKAGAILFFILGALSFWFLVGFLFLALGVAAWFTKIYKYSLQIIVGGEPIVIACSSRQSGLKDIARTIQGLTLSQKLLTFAST